MGKWLKIDVQAANPIFLQVVEAIEQKILTGEFAHETFLPSVRDLAVDLGINPNTVAKAYLLLQQNGSVESVRGLGLKVKGLGRKAKDDRRQQLLKEKCEELIETGEALGFSWSEILSALNSIKNKGGKWKAKAL